jgi:hypothetical protein
MGSNQDAPKRRKEKAKRTKKLDKWRADKAEAEKGGAAKAKPKSAPKS